MDDRPFYSPRTPTPSHIKINSSSFPFPSSVVAEDDDLVRLLPETLEEEIGFEDHDELIQSSYGDGNITPGQMTPLDLSLERIGMKRYQWSLLILCGMGWTADNMHLQCIAVILPRVQEHYNVSNQWIGILSTSIFAGMMIGSYGWGVFSDMKGRIPAFNYTLFFTAIFGVLAAFAPSFFWLCIALFGLGTSVGGSMPTDGTLLLENIPKSRHNLLTGLSIFFSFGAVIASLLGLHFIPRYSCPENPLPGVVCDVEVENKGWRYILLSLSLISVVMFILRIVFFRLQESAKFLMTSGRSTEAIVALTRISKFNKDSEVFTKADVVDVFLPQIVTNNEASTGGTYNANGNSPEGSVRREVFEDNSTRGRTNLSAEVVGISPLASPRLTNRSRQKSHSISNDREWINKLPISFQTNVEDYMKRIDGLFEPEWKMTTTLVWWIWFLASGGYTIFNVFLPKYLEEKIGVSSISNGVGGREASLKEYVMYTMAGMPGSLIGAYLIETSLGRKGTMAISTLATSLGIFIFILVDTQVGVVISSMSVSLAATLMYAVIYGYTPEVFPSAYRGTACGIASAFSRLAGIIAPLLTGLMLNLNVSLPLYVSGICFIITAGCMICLPIETRIEGRVGRRGVGVH